MLIVLLAREEEQEEMSFNFSLIFNFLFLCTFFSSTFYISKKKAN
jgi:hypothetical protein